ncbi:CLUMA_CG012777, isoform A [Clunio marinus]|uniref:CLUMA_CG012777, isoform A n=1 Tax=Clunio marinus TaxID=568069 RepID=A0A1J1IGR2_9DIPT|nr:CLUMA_CG012777, isoform A [Clunio marinus]
MKKEEYDHLIACIKISFKGHVSISRQYICIRKRSILPILEDAFLTRVSTHDSNALKINVSKPWRFLFMANSKFELNLNLNSKGRLQVMLLISSLDLHRSFPDIYLMTP